MLDLMSALISILELQGEIINHRNQTFLCYKYIILKATE